MCFLVSKLKQTNLVFIYISFIARFKNGKNETSTEMKMSGPLTRRMNVDTNLGPGTL